MTHFLAPFRLQMAGFEAPGGPGCASPAHAGVIFEVHFGHFTYFPSSCYHLHAVFARIVSLPASPAHAGVIVSGHSGHCERVALLRPEYCGVCSGSGQNVPVLASRKTLPLLNFHSKWPRVYCPCEGFLDPPRNLNYGDLRSLLGPKMASFDPF